MRKVLTTLAVLLALTSLAAAQPQPIGSIPGVSGGNVPTSTTTGGWIFGSSTNANVAPAIISANYTGCGAGGWDCTVNGTLNKSADGTGTIQPNPVLTITAGRTYKVTITTGAVTVGSATLTLGGTPSQYVLSAATTYVDYISAATTANLIITPTNTSRLTITAISVQFVNPNGNIEVRGSLTARGPVLLSPGSAASGSVQFNAANTALYGSSAGSAITLETAGTARAVFNASGATFPGGFNVQDGADNTKQLTLSLTSMTASKTQTWQVGGTDVAPTLSLAAASGTPGITAFSGVAGTGTNIVGGNVQVAPGAGTGTGAGTAYQILRNLIGTTGTTTQTQGPGVTICESKTLSNTSATLTTLAQVQTTSNSSGAVHFIVSVQCTDGTNFDSDVLQTYVGFVNKAGTVTIGTPVSTASAAANNSGSCTVAPTVTASGNNVLLNVTPVITTIVPTTTTGYINVSTFGPAAVACQ